MSWRGPVIAGAFFVLRNFLLFSFSSTFILFGVGLRWHETDPNVKVQDVTVVVSTREEYAVKHKRHQGADLNTYYSNALRS